MKTVESVDIKCNDDLLIYERDNISAITWRELFQILLIAIYFMHPGPSF